MEFVDLNVLVAIHEFISQGMEWLALENIAQSITYKNPSNANSF